LQKFLVRILVIVLRVALREEIEKNNCIHPESRKNHFYTMNKPVSIGPLQLGGMPRVVAIIDEFLDMHHIKELAKIGVDIVEIRIDLIGSDIPSLCVFVDKIKKFTGFPCIATVRQTEENREKRLDIFKAVIPFVDAVDIEIDASIARQVIAHAQAKTIIVSEHDFEKTPDISHLESIATKAEALGAHIVKIATMANNQHDVARLLEFTAACKKDLVTIAMGEYGNITRVLAPMFGSLFTYGFVKKSVAPGQFGVHKLIEELRLYYPAFDKKCTTG
jgi:3-dehydroquinate dehydratase I